MIHSSNRGNMVASRNCFDHSSGDYLAFLTTDDVWEPDMLKILTGYLDEHPLALGVFAQPMFIDEEGTILDHPHTRTGGGVGLTRYQQLKNIFWLINYFCCPTAMIRRSTFEKHGYFAPYLRQIHDMAYWTRLLFEGELAILPDQLLRFRIRSNFENAGSQTPENWRRTHFEVLQNLRVFVEKIRDIDLLTKIFPEAKNHPWPLENRLVKFHLAQIALNTGMVVNRLFGLQLLYELLSDEAMADYIRKVCNFDFTDMFRLQGEAPIFASDREYGDESSLHRNASLKEELALSPPESERV
jgi:glycosyltransferase involved in cell wall biosynthesis